MLAVRQGLFHFRELIVGDEILLGDFNVHRLSKNLVDWHCQKGYVDTFGAAVVCSL